MDHALTLLVRDLQDKAVNEMPFYVDRPEYADIFSTTWQELRDCFMLTQIPQTQMHWLTGSGWYAGVKVSGKTNEPSFTQQMRKLSATLKDYVKGRQDERLVTVYHVAEDARLPFGFVYNAIESRLLDHEFNMKGAEWTIQKNPKIVIRVPLNFGLEPL
jgi:hypothetical protein